MSTTERIVIVGYKPLTNKKKELDELMKTHWQILHNEGLVSDRKPILMEAKDGTVLEVFGWKSKEAIESAHTNPTVQKMWGDFSEVCEYIPIREINETRELFSEFTPLQLNNENN